MNDNQARTKVKALIEAFFKKTDTLGLADVPVARLLECEPRQIKIFKKNSDMPAHCFLCLVESFRLLILVPEGADFSDIQKSRSPRSVIMEKISNVTRTMG